MKVALVVPYRNELLNATCVPYGLACIASYLRKFHPDIEVKIIDGMAGYNVDTEIFNFQPGIVGITASTPQAPEAYKLADMLKRNRPDIKVVMGGVHASSLPEEAVHHVDHVVIGEGEIAFKNLVESYLNNRKPPAIIQGVPLDNLDDIPMVNYSELPVRNYLYVLDMPNLPQPVMNMVTSRGCPYRCPFCYNSGRTSKVRYQSAERVVKELLYLHSNYNVDSFYFSDDEMLINTKRLRKLRDLLQAAGALKWLRWGCQTRSKTLTLPTLRLAKSAGCVLASIGIESGNQRMLNYWKQGTTTLADHEQAFRNCEEVGIAAGGSFIYGGFNETLEEMQETWSWFIKQPLKFVGTGTIIPYPNTDVWRRCMKEGLLPNPVDYHMLIPTYYTNETYVIDKAINPEEYRKFLIHTARMARIHCRSRFRKSLKDFAITYPRHLVWWWAWINHPKQMTNILVNILRRNIHGRQRNSNG